MKWNWGTKIAILYSSFAVFIGLMVVMSFNEKYDLVTEDYYAKEIAFQSTIDSRSRAEALDAPLQTSINGNQLTVVLPTEAETVVGNLNCFRPSDEKLDFDHSFQSKHFSIPLQNFEKGKYLLKFQWEADGENFYHERTIIIP